MAESATASASVATETPARYAKQLASLLGHRVSVVEEEAGTRIVLPLGSCLMTPAGEPANKRRSAGAEMCDQGPFPVDQRAIQVRTIPPRPSKPARPAK